MDKYINANDLEDMVMKSKSDNPHQDNLQRQMHIHEHRHFLCMINSMPAADVVEVVRCKDCKHATFYSCKNDACYKGIICEYKIGTFDEDFFCSCGERK